MSLDVESERSFCLHATWLHEITVNNLSCIMISRRLITCVLIYYFFTLGVAR